MSEYWGISEIAEAEHRKHRAKRARINEHMLVVHEARKEELARIKAAAVAAGTDQYVWLVTTGTTCDNNDYQLHGVFSTEPLAEAFAVEDRVRERYFPIDQYRIERWFLDCGAWQYEDAKMWPVDSKEDGNE